VRQILIALAILWAGAAQASQIEILSIKSGWDVESIVDTRDRGALLTGEGSNEIRWGESFPGHSGKSGFRFKETSVGTTQAANKLFDVGVFTHMNRVIYQGEHLDRAWLNMSITARFDDDIVRTFDTSYLFSLWETPNYQNPKCANGEGNALDKFGNRKGGGGAINVNGCADRVRLLKNDSMMDKFTHDGLTYTFELFGFESGKEFWTIEDLDNDTWLKARFNVTGPGGSTPVIPLPAGAWLLIGALGTLGLVRRTSRG
jgi:hypothetical protein